VVVKYAISGAAHPTVAAVHDVWGRGSRRGNPCRRGATVRYALAGRHARRDTGQTPTAGWEPRSFAGKSIAGSKWGITRGV